MRQRRPTMQDVADRAGVSKVAVSVVLSGKQSSVRVGEDTRQRILAAVAELGYQPNVLWRSLLSRQPEERRTGIIGIYTGDAGFTIDQPYYADLLAGVQRALARAGVDLLLSGTQAASDSQVRYRSVISGKVDGILAYTWDDDQVVRDLCTRRFPVVSIVNAMPGIPSVVADESLVGRLLIERLRARGITRAIWRAALPGSGNVDLREQGLMTAAAKAGIRIDRVQHDYQQPAVSDGERRLLDPATQDRAQAILCFSDHVTQPILIDLVARGWRVPDDVAVYGVDGIERYLDQEPRWRLTTVEMGWKHLAEVAAGHLIEAIAGRPVAKRTVLPVRLRTGDTG